MSYRRSRTDRRRTRKLTGSKKRPTFERLEDRRLLTILIDDFDNSLQIAADPAVEPPPGVMTSSSLVSPSVFENDPLRNERDLFTMRENGAENVVLQTAAIDMNGLLTVPLNELSFSLGSGTTGKLIVTYDGVDGSGAQPPTPRTDLLNLNLSENGANTKFEFNGATELTDVFAIFRVWGADSQDFTVAMVELPVTTGGLIPNGQAPIAVPFGDFVPDPNNVGVVDFTDVGAIEIEFQRLDANGEPVSGPFDGRIDNVRAVNGVLGSIHAFGFEDLNADGIFDAQDIPWISDTVTNLPPKKIDLLDAQGIFITSQMTNENGEVWFEDLQPGTYMLMEDLDVFDGSGQGPVMASPDPDGAGPIPGGADKRTVTIGPGEELVWENGAALRMGPLDPGQEEVLIDDETTGTPGNGINEQLVFGNFVKASIHAFGYFDENANGEYEPLLNDLPWFQFDPDNPKTIQLTGDVNGDGFVNVIPQQTDDTSQVWFENLTPGTYQLVELTNLLPAGIVASPGEERVRTITVSSGEEWVWEDGAAAGMLEQGQFEVLVDTPPINNDLNDDLTFGNTTDIVLGSIHAFGFEDLNADGILDDEDFPWISDPDTDLPAKKIDLFDASGDFLASEMTDENGQVWFENLTPGIYMLMEDLTVFDGNGLGPVMASPEPDSAFPIPGGADKRTVVVGPGEELVWQDGAAEGMLDPGQEEVLIDDDTTGTPGNGINEQLVFGNFVKASIHAFGYFDEDADGEFEPGDDDLPWFEFDPLNPKTIQLMGDVDGDGDMDVRTEMTDATSQVWFEDLTPGTYELRELTNLLPDGITASPGEERVRTITVSSGEEWVWEDGAAAGMLEQGQFEVLVDTPPINNDLNDDLTFGNTSDVVPGSIHAFGFEDLDADGILDAQDIAWNRNLPPKKIDLFDASGNFLDSELTDDTGQVWFLGLTPGVYMLQEDLTVFDGNGQGAIMASPDPDGPGGVPGGADKRTVTVGNGQELVWQDGAAMLDPNDPREEVLVDDGRLIFGNFVKASIHAFGYFDEDADGEYEPGEGDQPWFEFDPDNPKTIELTGDVDGDGDNETLSEQTDDTSQVWFENLTPGTYELRERTDLLPDGISASPGEDRVRTVTVLSGQELVWQDGAAAGMLEQGQFEVLIDTPPINNGLNEDLTFGNTRAEKAKIKGKVFVDKYKDGYFNEYKDKELKGVKIILSLQETGEVIDEVYTDEWGRYEFTHLQAGVAYKITQIQPHEFKDGPNIPGWSINEADVGVVEFKKDVVNDMFTNIVLESGECAEGFNFTEHYFSKRDFTSRYDRLFDSVWNVFDSVWDSFGSFGHSSSGDYSSGGYSSSGQSSGDQSSGDHSSTDSGSQYVSKRDSTSRRSRYSSYSKQTYSSSATYNNTSTWSQPKADAADSIWTSYGSSWSSSGSASTSRLFSRFSFKGW